MRAGKPLARLNVWAKLGASNHATRGGRLRGWYPGGNCFMPVRVGNSRRKILAALSFFALQAGLAAGPIRAGAEAEPAARVAAATTTTVPTADAAPAPALAAEPAPTPPAPSPAAAPVPTPPAPPAPWLAAALVPADRLYLQPVLEQAAAENGLPKDLVLAQAWAESSWRVDAVSPIGALGVLQLTPDTVDF